MKHVMSALLMATVAVVGVANAEDMPHEKANPVPAPQNKTLESLQKKPAAPALGQRVQPPKQPMEPAAPALEKANPMEKANPLDMPEKE